MGKFCMITLALVAIIMSISVVESIVDQRPEAVEKWFKKLGEKKEKVTKLHFFLHEAAAPGSADETAFVVAVSNITSTSPTIFGQVSVVDDVLREGPEPDSPIVGRVQGLDTSTDLREPALVMSLNFVFTTGKYNGSSLSFLGRNPLSQKYRELAVLGGTGYFRLARGIITTNTVMFSVTTGVTIAEFRVIVLHY